MPRFRTLALLAGDLTVLVLSYLAVAFALIKMDFFPEMTLEIFLSDEPSLQRIGLVTVSLLLAMYFAGLYESIRGASKHVLFEDLILCFGIAFLVQALVSYMRSNLVLSRYIMIGGSALAIVGLISWRVLYTTIVLNVLGKQRVLFIGRTQMATDLAEMMLAQPERGFQSIGCLDLEEYSEESFPGSPMISIKEELADIVERLSADRISISGGIESREGLTQKLLSVSMQGLQVESVGDLYEDLHRRVALETLTLNQLVFSPAFRPHVWVTICQELYCRLIAATGLLVCWPIMLLTALAVRMDSPGPALLRQVRLGKRGKPFPLLKFRSMFVDADKISGPVRAKENDPRITRVGRWIRQTRIDELPQLINVLKGEMMLVGPRPEMPALEEELLKDIPLYKQRHRIKPGITGWAQIHHSPEDSIDSTRKKLEYDLYYIKKMSPGLDMLIMFYTIKAVIFRIGAR